MRMFVTDFTLAYQHVLCSVKYVAAVINYHHKLFLYISLFIETLVDDGPDDKHTQKTRRMIFNIKVAKPIRGIP